MKERATFPDDLWKSSGFFFNPPKEYDEKVIRKKWNDNVADVFDAYPNQLAESDVNTPEAFKELLLSVLEEKGMTLIPIKLMLTEKGFAKIEVGVGKGKKIYDKRESLKKRDADLEMRRKIREK